MALTKNSEGAGERGASLILALVFLTIVSLIVLALGSWASTGLRNTLSYTAAQSSVSTANSIAEVALQEVRTAFYSNTLWAQPPVSCWPPNAFPSSTNNMPPDLSGINAQNMTAWCATRWNPSSQSQTRIETVSVCPSSVSALGCAQFPYLQVVAAFDDYPETGGFANCYYDNPSDWSTCGTYMTIESWVWATSPPTVDYTAPPSPLPNPYVPPVTNPAVPAATATTCPATSPNSFSLNGTGFILNHTTVLFISHISSGASTTTQVLAGTNIVPNSAGTYLTGCLPGTSPTSAEIMVVTPVGQSSQLVPISY